MRAIHKVLIANRGETAVRIIRAVKELGLVSTVVHSDADADSLAVRPADEAVHSGPSEPSQSYPDINLGQLYHLAGKPACTVGAGMPLRSNSRPCMARWTG